MGINYRRMNTPDLISKVSAARKAEAEYRLAEWDMGAKNVRRLEAYLAGADKAPAPKAKATPAPAVVAQAEAVTDKVTKALAKQAFDLAFAAAPEGSRQKAGKRAFGLVLRGETTDAALAAEAALASL